MGNGNIDIIIPWVDGSDPKWLLEKNKYKEKNKIIEEGNSEIRYQNWDNLQYVFRGIEKFMPWVHKVYFVTWGHKPIWLNEKYERLVVLRHQDFIPEKYLPTFNSNVIEMNYFRIDSLSENFILFNDDLFPISPIREEYYFVNGVPCAEAVETHFPLVGEMNVQMLYAFINNMLLINKYFDKREVIQNNYDKWINPIYGKRLAQNENLLFWNHFESFVYPHEAKPIKKSVIKEIWEKEPELMERVSANKFRAYSDVTQQLITMWQICSGNFVPHKFKGMFFETDMNNCYGIAEIIRNQECPILSLNECTVEDFYKVRGIITEALNDILPEKSAYEL